MKLTLRYKGGPGSGHKGHAGRPGEIGGSLPGKGSNIFITISADKFPAGTKIIDIPFKDRDQPSGAPIRGDKVISVDDPIIPDIVYHMTTNLSGVKDSNEISARGEGGLGGDKEDQMVSMTINEDLAYRLADDMKFNIDMAKKYVQSETESVWDEETKKWLYLDKQGNAVDRKPISETILNDLHEQSVKEGWDFGIEWPDIAKEQYGLHSWFTQYYVARESQAKIPNPVIYTNTEILAKYDSVNVGIVEIPKANLKTGALLVDFDLRRIPYGLQEIRLYGDVPLNNATSKEYEDTAIIAFNLHGNKFITDIQDQIPVDGVEDPHITILMLGLLENLDARYITFEHISSVLEEFATMQSPIVGEFTGVAMFDKTENSDGKQAIVMLYDSPQLPYLRVRLKDYLESRIKSFIPQDHGFIPHVTLAYDTDLLELDYEERVKYTFDSIWLFWGDNHVEFPLTGNVTEKQLPIDESSKANLISIRTNMFNNDVDDLAERMYTGEISLGQWEDSMRKSVRELHSSVAAIGKGGWDRMEYADWGKLGPEMKAQYKYLHGFAENIAENRDTISLNAITARAHMYGNAAAHSAYLIEAGDVFADKLPWLPRDGSTTCLVNCQCRWELEIVEKRKGWNIVQATWRLGEAEHCDDCVERNGHVEILKVHETVTVPTTIGGY